MSLATSLLLAFLPAIVRPKPEPEKTDRERELEGRVQELEEALELARLERDSARRRLDDASDMLARLGRQRIGERLEAGVLTPAQQHGHMLAQYAAMQQAQQNAMAYQQGLANPLQQAAYQQMQGVWCNCVPARHDMFLGGLGA